MGTRTAKTIDQARRAARTKLWQALNGAHSELTDAQIDINAGTNFTEGQMEVIENLILAIDELQGDVDRVQPCNEHDDTTSAK